MGQEPLLPWLVLADGDGDEVPHLASQEHLGWRTVGVPVRGVPLGQQGSAEPVFVEAASRAQVVSDHPLHGIDSELRTCVPVGVVCDTEPVPEGEACL